jgi:ribosomal protein S18 acetylase RimI-like enzyme
MDIIYRKLRPEETAAYREIRLECLKNFPDWFGSVFEEQVNIPKLHGETVIEEQKPESFILGAFVGDKLVGICGFTKETRIKTKHRAEVTQVYVKPEYQGKKMGEGMIRALAKEAFANPEVEQLELGVETNNPSAIRTYEKVGFTTFGHIKHYFKVGDKYFDEYLMVLYRNSK